MTIVNGVGSEDVPLSMELVPEPVPEEESLLFAHPVMNRMSTSIKLTDVLANLLFNGMTPFNLFARFNIVDDIACNLSIVQNGRKVNIQKALLFLYIEKIIRNNG